MPIAKYTVGHKKISDICQTYVVSEPTKIQGNEKQHSCNLKYKLKENICMKQFFQKPVTLLRLTTN